MFCVLKFIEEEKGIRSFFKNLFNKKLPEPKQVNLMSAAPFFYLEISRKQCGENFERLSELLGPCSRFILLCKDTEIPDNAYVKKYRPTVFPSVILLNSAEKILQSRHYDRSKYSIALVDRKGQFFGRAERLVTLASVIVIFTDNSFLYKGIAEDIFERYGASLIIRRSESLEFNCDFTVLPEENCIIERLDNSYKKITGASFNLPQEYEKLRPDLTDKLSFASALYELCAVKKLESVKYSSFSEAQIGEKGLNVLTTGHF